MAGIDCVFFDIGGTLGDVDGQLKLHVFADSRKLLESLQAPGRRFGIISNVPPTMKGPDVIKLLNDAGIGDLFEDELVVASTDAPKPKPDAAIYALAAKRAGVAMSACLFVGEDIGEVIGARLAGMNAQLKPRL